MLNKPSLKDRIIKAFISAVVDGKSFPKVGPEMCCSRYEIFALTSECDDAIPLHLCKKLGVPKGSTYSDAAIAAALRETGSSRRWWW
jgi:hypothetical protein